MFCSSCGAQIPEGSAFCPQCGAAVTAPAQPEQPSYQQTDYQQPSYQQPAYQQSDYQQTPYQANGYQQPVYQQQSYGQTDDKYHGHPMKWHKFLVYFALWASAVGYAANGLMFLTGESSISSFYAYYPSLKTVDMICGALCLALAVFGVYTALQLLKLKEGAPSKLILYMMGGLVVSVSYSVLISVTAGVALNFTEIAPSVVVEGGLIGLHNTYYKKRADLFVN